MEKIKIAIAGLGSRGHDAYGTELLKYKDRVEIVAIADTNVDKLKRSQILFNITEDRCFNSAEDMLKKSRMADAVIIATPDRQHVEQGINALKKGYHLLLEKPVTSEIDELKKIVNVSKEAKKHVIVCHVLRYTPFFNKLKEIISSGVIGDVVSTIAYEDVGYWHQAHSFVRGNWRNAEESSPMFLQKCSHDMDIYLWLLNKKCKNISSFGSLFLFKEENAPKGSTKYCMEGCKVKTDCPFDAEKIYITNKHTGIRSGNNGWPNNVLVLDPTEDKVLEAIKKGPYGKCVYHNDNNVVDHQVVNLQLEDNSTFSFTMCGLTNENVRHAKFMGTKGEIIADMGKNIIEINPFLNKNTIIDTSILEEGIQGHAGGDEGIIKDFIGLLSNEKSDLKNMTTLEDSTHSHYICIGAETSMNNNGKVVNINEIV